jgi:hypothetical protein
MRHLEESQTFPGGETATKKQFKNTQEKLIYFLMKLILREMPCGNKSAVQKPSQWESKNWKSEEMLTQGTGSCPCPPHG